jgi:F-type H+-transporting ATPase subunit gamma
MPGTKEIKQRIKSVKNTKKITKAMELVAASKMKRAVSRTLSSRLYSSYSLDLLKSIAHALNKITHPFFSGREAGSNLIVIITSNNGLCGAYNSQVLKTATLFLKNMRDKGESFDIVTIGKKGDSAMRRLGQNVISSFVDIPDNATPSDISPLSKLLIDEYRSGTYKNIYMIYTDFVSALTQKANVRKILPISKEALDDFITTIENLDKSEPDLHFKNTEYIFEGDMDTLIGELAEKLTRIQVYQMILESSASEQSSRMLAMKNASDAAGEMIDDLTLVFNKARQAGITQEISEISAGMASVS